MSLDVLYLIAAASLGGGILSAAVAELVGAYVWAGRRRFPRRPR